LAKLLVVEYPHSTTKYVRYQNGVTYVNLSVIVHSRNSNKQHLILTKFYANNAPFIANKIAKFQINLPKQTTATAAFARSLQNTSVSGLCV